MINLNLFKLLVIAAASLITMTTTATTTTAAYAQQTDIPPWVDFDEIDEDHQPFINDTITKLQQAIAEEPENVRIVIYPEESFGNPKITITYNNGTAFELEDDMEISIPSNITTANGYTFESDDIIKPNGERLFE